MPANRWQFIPSSILEEQRRNDEADSWVESERQKLASNWASEATRWLNKTLTTDLGQEARKRVIEPLERETQRSVIEPLARAGGTLASTAGEALGRIQAVGLAPVQSLAYRRVANIANDPNNYDAYVRHEQQATGAGYQPRIYSREEFQQALNDPELFKQIAGVSPEPNVLEAVKKAATGSPESPRTFESFMEPTMRGVQDNAQGDILRVGAGGAETIADISTNPLSLAFGASGFAAPGIAGKNLLGKAGSLLVNPLVQTAPFAASNIPKLSGETDEQYEARVRATETAGLASLPLGLAGGLAATSRLGQAARRGSLSARIGPKAGMLDILDTPTAPAAVRPARPNAVNEEAVISAAERAGLPVRKIEDMTQQPAMILPSGLGIFNPRNLAHRKMAADIAQQLRLPVEDESAHLPEFLRDTGVVRVVARGRYLGIESPYSLRELPRGLDNALGAVASRMGLLDDQIDFQSIAWGEAPPVSGAMAATAPRSVSPVVDSIVFREPPRVRGSALRPYEVGPLEGARRSVVSKITNRGVYADKLQQDVAKNVDVILDEDEQLAELIRLDPYKAAEVKLQVLRPAIQRVGRNIDLLPKLMVAQGNQDVARAIGQRVERAKIAANVDPVAAAAMGQLAAKQRKFSSGLNLETSIQAEKDILAAVSPEEAQALQEAADTFYKFNNALLKEKLDAGLITQELYDQLVQMYPRFSHAIILRHIDDAALAKVGSGKSIRVSSNDVRRLTTEGTESIREDPMISTIRYAMQTSALVRKNNAFNALVKLRELDPELAKIVPKVKPVPRGRVQPKYSESEYESVSGFVKGVKEEYLMPKYLGDVVTQVTKEPIEGLSQMAALFRALVTSRNPLFLPANFLMDMATYTIREAARAGGPQTGGPVFAELISAYIDTFKGLSSGTYAGPKTKGFLLRGGGLGQMTNITPDTGEKMVQKLGRAHPWTIQNKGDVGRIIKDVLTLKPIEAIGERIELAPHVAAERNALRRGLNPVEATIAGRTSTIDFAQGGYLAKWLNSIVPFFNVGVQAGATLYRSIKENPLPFFMTAVVDLMMPAAGAEIWNRADPERSKAYDDVPNYIKNQGIVFMLPEGVRTSAKVGFPGLEAGGVYAPVDDSGNPRPQFIFIRTREFSPFVVATREALTRAYGKEPQSFNSLLWGVLPSVTPLQGESLSGAVAQLTPPFVSTATQLYADKDFFRGTKIATAFADENAAPVFKELSKRLNGAVRPSQLEWAFRDVSGGVGQGASEILKVAGGQPISGQAGGGVSNIPVLGATQRKFLRGDIGGTLETAKERLIDSGLRQQLLDDGVSYSPGPVSSRLGKVQLTVTQQAHYQDVANRYVEQYIRRAMQTPAYRRGGAEAREKVIRDAVSSAHERAANDMRRTLGGGGTPQRIK